MTHPRALLIAVTLALIALLAWRFFPSRKAAPPETSREDSRGQGIAPAAAQGATAAEKLLEGYGEPDTSPIEDLRKIHRVITGYFSVVKDASRNPIGGNLDLAAALRGENPNREVFVHDSNPIFGKDGSIVDRWGSPIVVHPEEFRRIGLRSAGPDRSPYTMDDLVLSPNGAQEQAK
ncbi:hypothetical protein [Haloferula sp. BvORR071]|uniref:hypothetical protein n=1 Tax=Haloferula sp. BvORR071 TaxID=1396141 RepID=UPI00055453E6|nr:hypothetical protein [Haloferula sp. BvORR071]